MTEKTTGQTSANAKASSPVPSTSTQTQTSTKSATGSPQPASPKKVKGSKAAHFVLQGKGGVGKTLVSNLLAQYLETTGVEVFCYDTDPVNHSLARIVALNVKKVPLYKDGTSDTDNRALDKMLSDMVQHPATYVIDNGASSFKPMSQHLISDGSIELLLDMDFSVVLHLIVSTGPELEMTISGVAGILDSVADTSVPVVVWINEKGVSFEEQTGTDFEGSTFYNEYKAQIAGIVTIPALPKASRSIFETMLNNKLTFDEAESSDTFYVIEQKRLGKLKESFFASIENGLEGV